MKLRPDLQTLLDEKLEQFARERAEHNARYGHWPSESYGRPPEPVEPYLLPAESPLFDALNVKLAMRARAGYRISPIATGISWPEHLPFPYEKVMSVDEVRKNAERNFAETDSDGERDVLLNMYVQMPYITATNFGGIIDDSLVVKQTAKELVVYGFGELPASGKLLIGADTFYVQRGHQRDFEHDGKVYTVDTIEVTGKVYPKKPKVK